MSGVNNIHQVFRRWSLHENSPNLESYVIDTLAKRKIDRDHASNFFKYVDLDGDGAVRYSDLEGWFLTHDVLRSAHILNKCRCPDGHDLQEFVPTIDGWLCEECGDDLEGKEAFQCEECDKMCWCARCIVQDMDVVNIEKGILSVIPTLRPKATDSDTANDREEAREHISETLVAPRFSFIARSDSDLSRPNKKQCRSCASLDFLQEGMGTPAEDWYIEEMVAQLACKTPQPRLVAVEALSSLVRDFRLAEAVCRHAQAICTPLEKKQDHDVHSEILSLLCKLVSQGQAETVGLQAFAFSHCLVDEDMIIARKAAVLCRRIADEGSASLLARYVPKLIECCERHKDHTAAPFEALTSIADAGEGLAVAPTTPRLHKMLLSKCRTRAAICSTLVGILRGGGGNDVYRLAAKLDAHEPRAPSSEDQPCLLRTLFLIIRDEDDKELRLSSARVLQNIVIFKEEAVNLLRNQHSLLMFNCLGALYNIYDREILEIRSIIVEMFGMEVTSPEEIGDRRTNNETDTSVAQKESDRLEVCCICFTSGLRCQLGGPRELPCKHTFHSQCISDWFGWEAKCGRGRTCPLCRVVVPDDPEGKDLQPEAKSPTRRQSSVLRLRAAVSAARQQT